MTAEVLDADVRELRDYLDDTFTARAAGEHIA